jgi:hypothetical protein
MRSLHTTRLGENQDKYLFGLLPALCIGTTIMLLSIFNGRRRMTSR